MLDQRRHPRIRFGRPPEVRIGIYGGIGVGQLENLSLSGMMLKTTQPLTLGQQIGCELSMAGAPLIDSGAKIVTRVGDFFGAHFQSGLINPVLIDDAITASLVNGKGSTLSVHTLQGKKVMRISGGLNGSLHNDFMHTLTRVGVEEIDLGGVTAVEPAGLSLCLLATGRHGVKLGEQSACFAEAWKRVLGGAPMLPEGSA